MNPKKKVNVAAFIPEDLHRFAMAQVRRSGVTTSELIRRGLAEACGNPWREYEREKAALALLPITPEEYQRRLAEIAARLGV